MHSSRGGVSAHSAHVQPLVIGVIGPCVVDQQVRSPRCPRSASSSGSSSSSGISSNSGNSAMASVAKGPRSSAVGGHVFAHARARPTTVEGVTVVLDTHGKPGDLHNFQRYCAQCPVVAHGSSCAKRRNIGAQQTNKLVPRSLWDY